MVLGVAQQPAVVAGVACRVGPAEVHPMLLARQLCGARRPLHGSLVRLQHAHQRQPQRRPLRQLSSANDHGPQQPEAVASNGGLKSPPAVVNPLDGLDGGAASGASLDMATDPAASSAVEASKASSSNGSISRRADSRGAAGNGVGSSGKAAGNIRLGPLAEVPRLMRDALAIARFALPISAQNLLGYSLNALSESLVGRLGAAALSSSTLGNSAYNLMGLSVVWGGAAGMETLCGQANGAGNKKLMRLILIRAVLVCWCICVPLVIMWTHAEAILLALGQAPTIAASSSKYLRALSPSMFAYVLAECLQTFLVVQGQVQAPTLAKGIVTLVGPLYYHTLMFRFELGIIGAGYAYFLCKFTNALILIGWVTWKTVRPDRRRAGADGSGSDEKSPYFASLSSFGSMGSLSSLSSIDGGSIDTAPTLAEITNVRARGAAAGGSGEAMAAEEAAAAIAAAAAATSRENERRQRRAASAMLNSDPSQGGSSTAPQDAVPDQHTEILSSPLSASASAHEYSIQAQQQPVSSGYSAGSSNGHSSPSGIIDLRPRQQQQQAAESGASTSSDLTGEPRPAQQLDAEPDTAPEGGFEALGRSVLELRGLVLEALEPRACWEYVKFGFPAALMSCLEWWAYEVLVLMAGWLPNAEVSLAALGVCLIVNGWVYMLPQGIATASCARVANALGAGDAKAARRNFRAAFGLVLTCQLVVLSVLLANARRVASFFCQDPAVATMTTALLPLSALNTLGDGLNCVMNSTLRACGRQALGARLHLMMYWCIGLPSAYFLGVKAGWGLPGFVMAIGATTFTQSIIVATIINRWDWNGQVANAQQLLSSMSQSMSSDTEAA